MLENILKTDYQTVKHLKYNIDHDGYDRYGPESDLHDIYIWYIKDNKFYIDNFHTEEWFNKGSKPMFEIFNTYEISTETDWLDLIKYNNYELCTKLTKNKKVYDFYE